MNYLRGNYMERIINKEVYIYKGEETEFNYFTSICAEEKIKFVKNVIETIVTDICYFSVIKDIVFDANIVDAFTDITLPKGINEIEEFLKETNIVEIIKENIEYGIIEELEKAVDDNIAYRTGIHKNPIAESFSSLIKTLEEKVSDIDTKAMMEMTQIISGMSGELTADKMLEAYINSDIFKNNQEQLIAKKEKQNAIIEEAKKVADKN